MSEIVDLFVELAGLIASMIRANKDGDAEAERQQLLLMQARIQAEIAKRTLPP
jgi:hypothetical protein